MTTKTKTNGAVRKVRGTTSTTKTSTKPPRPNAENQPEAPVVKAPIPSFTPKAWALMTSLSIQGVPILPIYFLGGLPYKIAQCMGRPIDEDEAKVLVLPDGDPVICSSEGLEFQPVKYAAFLSREMEEGLRAGKRLDEVEIFYGGCFQVMKDRSVLAFSGPLYFHNQVKGRYQHVKSSPLVIAAEEGKRFNHGEPMWGVPSEVVAYQTQSRENGHVRHNKIGALMKNAVRAHRPRKDDFGAIPQQAQDMLNGLSRGGKRCKDRSPRRQRRHQQEESE